MRCSTSSIASSALYSPCRQCLRLTIRSAIDTTTPGRIDKSQVLQALQSSGESYDVARETLKHVSVDASGKVELEDWVEVRDAPGGDELALTRCAQLNVKLTTLSTEQASYLDIPVAGPYKPSHYRY